MLEKRIGADDLIATLPAILDEMVAEGTVYIVDTGEPSWRGDLEFVLGPEELCRSVVGLVDVEYGWPARVDADAVHDVRSLAPSYRRHPYICKGDRCAAVAIQVSEYEQIRRRFR